MPRLKIPTPYDEIVKLHKKISQLELRIERLEKINGIKREIKWW